MTMNWYHKEFVNFFTVSDKKVVSYLSKLTNAGVPVENIKVVGMENNWLMIYYYSDKEIE
jgi:hypothetical protein